MGNLAQVQTSEVVSTVATPATIPNTIVAVEPLDLPFNNYRAFTPTIAATIFTPDLSQGSGQIIIGTAAAFTIANPINPPAQNANSQFEMVIQLVNTSGGALGAITMGSQYRTAGAVVAPATGNRRYYTFMNVGTQAAPVWSETGRSAADTPN
jgi:hypothetical protein